MSDVQNAMVASIRKLEERQDTILAAIARLESRIGSRGTDALCSQVVTTFSRFEGVVPNPNAGRSSKTTSFVNVGMALKKGIDDYNLSLDANASRLVTEEFNGSLLAWSNSSMASVRNILGRYRDLNDALGSMSLEAIRKQPRFVARPSKYNREVAAVVRDIRRTIPVVIVAKGDWAARELLRNTFRNDHSGAKRREKQQLLKTRRSGNDESSKNGIDANNGTIPSGQLREESHNTRAVARTTARRVSGPNKRNSQRRKDQVQKNTIENESEDSKPTLAHLRNSTSNKHQYRRGSSRNMSTKRNSPDFKRGEKYNPKKRVREEKNSSTRLKSQRYQQLPVTRNKKLRNENKDINVSRKTVHSDSEDSENEQTIEQSDSEIDQDGYQINYNSDDSDISRH